MAIKEKPFWLLFLLLWCMLIFYLGNIASYAPRHLDLVIIPFYIFAAYCLSWLHSRYKIAAYLSIIYLVSAMFIFLYPMLAFRHHYNGAKQFALYVKEKTETNAVIISMDDSPFVNYYGQRKTLNPPVGDDKEKINNFVKVIKRYLANNIPVYLMESALSYDEGNFLKAALDGNFSSSLVGEKLSEDFHRPELGLQTYKQKLFKIGGRFWAT
jgi:hypothetical protein